MSRLSSITDPEVHAFLTEGTRTGKLSFLSPSGRPLVTPVWFVVEDDTLVFNTGKDTAKGRALARDPRVSLCVDLEAPPYAFVQVQGAAELSEDPGELVRIISPARWSYSPSVPWAAAIRKLKLPAPGSGTSTTDHRPEIWTARPRCRPVAFSQR